MNEERNSSDLYEKINYFSLSIKIRSSRVRLVEKRYAYMETYLFFKYKLYNKNNVNTLFVKKHMGKEYACVFTRGSLMLLTHIVSFIQQYKIYIHSI